MIIDALRRSLVRLFGRPAISPPPETGMERVAPGTHPSGSPGDVRVITHQELLASIASQLDRPPAELPPLPPLLPPSSELSPSPMNLDDMSASILRALQGAGFVPLALRPPPPASPPIDDTKPTIWTWTNWMETYAEIELPGWTVCRYPIRRIVPGQPDQARFMFGIVRGAFGIHLRGLDCCIHESTDEDEDAVHGDRKRILLAHIAHLRTGIELASFNDRQHAAAAADLAERVCPEWRNLDGAWQAWSEAKHRTVTAWGNMGIGPIGNMHAHDDDPQETGRAVWSMTHDAAARGKPEKTS